MSLDSAIGDLVQQVPECVACGVVDISTGMLLAIKTTDSHPQEVLDLVAAATGDLFQGANVVAIENMFKQVRGVSDSRHYFQEIIVNSDNLLHIFQRGKRNEDLVMVTVCRISANLGMALTKARRGLSTVEAAF